MTAAVRVEDAPPLGVNEVHLWRMAREGATLHFDLTHTPGLAVLVLTPDGPLGADVERIRRTERALEVAHGFFSPGEVAALGRLPEEELQLAFLRCWTRKEAVVKALGTGLSGPLDSFDVSVGPVAHVIGTRGGFPGQEVWQLLNLPLPAEYVGALAIAGVAAPRVWVGDLVVNQSGEEGG